MTPHVSFHGAVAVLRPVQARLSGADLAPLERQLMAALDSGRCAALLDLSGVRRISASGLGAVTELARRWNTAIGPNAGAMHFALCGLDAAVTRQISRFGLQGILPVHDTAAAAMEAPAFRALSLRGHKAVVLAASRGTRMAPLTHDVPKPMLDMLGKPLVDRVVDHLKTFGLRDIILNPGHLGDTITSHFRGRRDVSPFYLREGHLDQGTWKGEPIGSASTLARLQHQHAAFDDDVIVVNGDTLAWIDLAAMMQAHKASGAMVTIAAGRVGEQDVSRFGILEAAPCGRVTAFQEKPTPQEARSRLASAGVYIFRPEAFAGMEDMPGQDIACDLIGGLLTRGELLKVFAPEFTWIDIGNPREYFATLAAGLAGEITELRPMGEEVSAGVWISADADLNARATIEGRCHIGAGARIAAGARIEGSGVIGAETRLDGRALIRNAMLWPGAWAQAGALLDTMIAAPDWAINHRFSDGSLLNRAPLDHVVAKRAAPARPSSPSIVRIA